eukprot:TRINITY_DN3915_c0_g1_i1.p1 TRINITY_DN3915_c0_g1~~TRINITY_DN3915_c0_g1_i1.p1  ORF type:complete len:377 (+),score=73.79 TRINITY_DN3915_c0_g1_i1:52-1131(+)
MIGSLIPRAASVCTTTAGAVTSNASRLSPHTHEVSVRNSFKRMRVSYTTAVANAPSGSPTCYSVTRQSSLLAERYQLKSSRSSSLVWKRWSHAVVQGDPMMEVLKNDSNGAVVYLLGTSHMDSVSSQKVQELIESVKPDEVMLAIDEGRAEALKQKKAQTMSSSEFETSLVQNRVSLPSTPFFDPKAMMDYFLAKYKKSFEVVGVIPGDEYLTAIDTAKKTQSAVIYGDRSIETTMKRVGSRMSDIGMFGWMGKMKKLNDLKKEMENGEHKYEDWVESFQKRDTTRVTVDSAHSFSPEMLGPMLYERDLFMVNKLKKMEGKKIVAVVGAIHVDGMVDAWNDFEGQKRMHSIQDSDVEEH